MSNQYEIETREVAFVIEIRGTYEVDHIVGEELPTDVIRNFANSMGPTAAVAQLVTYGKDVEVKIAPDDSRNYPASLGGYLMPEIVMPETCDDCGGALDHAKGECR